MLKKIIKKIALKFYEIGYFESLNIANEKSKNRINSIATLGKDVWVADNYKIYNNSLPKENIVIGDRSKIMGQLFLFDVDGKIVIGEDCFVGSDTRIWSTKSIKIGNRVLIAHNVNIHDNISHPLNAKDRYEENVHFVQTGMHKKADIKPEDVIIGDDVWIGFNTTILRGVTIGNGAIIGAGSVVLKDVEAWTVNVGNPLRCIQKLEPQNF
jgi:acetyltransferase-like isoleucine patch superfamily enzyme